MGAFAFAEFRAGKLWLNMPSRSAYPVRGIDVSHHQGRIRWKLVAQDQVQFAYIKATEGGDFVDPDFKRNWTEAAEAGLLRGAYHFFTLCRSGVEQARHFAKTLPQEPQLPPVVDLEFTGNCNESQKVEDPTKEIEDFLTTLESLTGRKTAIYTTYDFSRTYLNDRTFARDIWIRDVAFEPRGAFQNHFTIWQYTMYARVQGVRGRVDMNAFHGSMDDFKSWANQHGLEPH